MATADSFQRRWTLRFVDQLVGYHAHPVSETDEGREHEGQLDHIARPIVREPQHGVSLAVVVFSDAGVVHTLRADPELASHSFSFSLVSAHASVAEAGDAARLPGGGML